MSERRKVFDWFNQPGRSHWDDCPGYDVDVWQAEVGNGDTRLGYRDWCLSQAEQIDHEGDDAYRGDGNWA